MSNVLFSGGFLRPYSVLIRDFVKRVLILLDGYPKLIWAVR